MTNRNSKYVIEINDEGSEVINVDPPEDEVSSTGDDVEFIVPDAEPQPSWSQDPNPSQAPSTSRQGYVMPNRNRNSPARVRDQRPMTSTTAKLLNSMLKIRTRHFRNLVRGRTEDSTALVSNLLDQMNGRERFMEMYRYNKYYCRRLGVFNCIQALKEIYAREGVRLHVPEVMMTMFRFGASLRGYRKLFENFVGNLRLEHLDEAGPNRSRQCLCISCVAAEAIKNNEL